MSWIEPATAVVSAASALIAVVIASWAVVESRRLERLRSNPEVILYLQLNERFEFAIDLVVHNIGTGPANKVTFEWPSDTKIFGRIPADYDRAHFIDNGIAFLAPGQKFVVSLDTYMEMDKTPVDVEVHYYRIGDSARSPFAQTFQLVPEMFGGLGNWEDKERKAQVAVASAMDALRSGQITIKLKDSR